MPKIAIMVPANTETHANLGRITSALEFAKECVTAIDELQLIF